MSDKLDRLVEIRVVDDNSGARIEGATLTFFANSKEFAVIPSTRDKDPSIRITDHDMIIGIKVECSHYIDLKNGNHFKSDIITLAQTQDEWEFRIPSNFRIKPKIFIGSSVEGRGEARVIQKEMAQYLADTVIWSQGVFGLSRGTLETLVEKVRSFTHAILVLTPDDRILKRAAEMAAARDNVLFELGLFMGALGRERTFIVTEASVRLPTDLAGITTAVFKRGEGITIESNMGPVVTTLLIEMGLI
jgi:predicted nucleotide-binding protein